MSEVTMPRLSDTMQEGTISRWLKHAGDEVKKGDTLAEIETDKATMDLESYEVGVLEQILVQEGATVPIGQAIAIIGTAADAQKQPPASTPAPAESAPPEDAQKPAEDARLIASISAPTEGPSKAGASPRRQATEERGGGKVIKVSPLARHMAEEHTIDLRQVEGTGPGGRIVRDDIEDYLEQKVPTREAPTAPTVLVTTALPVEVAAPPVQVSTPTEAEISPLSRVQTIIARRLTEAKQTIPHFYVTSEVDMTDVLVMRQTLNASVGEGGVKVTVNDLIVKACALALEKFPEVNSSFKENQVILYKHINIGIAVDIPPALVVPTIHDANSKGVRTIAREAKALIEKARANKLSTSDLEGGTFSVSNLGMMDVTDFVAVINPPQAAILAVASIRKQFVPMDGQPVIRDLMAMTMSADHRILYGAAVARFLQEIKRLLQNPYSLLG
jgi:pyruvate dehydrogenase E2 component (dihydrolipoamide acetyltransferase)